MTNVMSQLLIPKYVNANTINAGRMAFVGEGSFTRGEMPATAKNRCAEHHAETEGADMLKRAR